MSPHQVNAPAAAVAAYGLVQSSRTEGERVSSLACLPLSTTRNPSWFFLIYLSLEWKTDLIFVKELKGREREMGEGSVSRHMGKALPHRSAPHNPTADGLFLTLPNSPQPESPDDLTN